MFFKYPNPFCAHVLTSDIIARHINPFTGALHTTRLFQKSSRLIPPWLLSIFKTRKAYILEETVVDPQTGLMTMFTRNLSHTRLLSASEYYQIARVGGMTETEIVQTVKCSLWGVAERIEAFLASKFGENMGRSRQALLYILERLPAPPTRRL